MFLFLSNLAAVELVAVSLRAGHHVHQMTRGHQDSGRGWSYLERKGRQMGILVKAWTAVYVVDTWVAKDELESIAVLCMGELINVVVELGLLTC